MAKTWTSERLDALETAFDEARDPERAVHMARYMKDRFAFYGIAAGPRRALQREVFRGAPKPTQRELVRITNASWRKKQRELQYFGADYVRQHVDVCDASFLRQLEKLITTKSWWDTVDLVAAHGVGSLALRFPSIRKRMNVWIDAENMWIARTALLYQLGYKADTDAGQLFDFCERRASDSEFFIRKAIGWALREYSKTDAKAVRNFVRENDKELSGLSKREALKWLER